jgi:hypothetical protein
MSVEKTEETSDRTSARKGKRSETDLETMIGAMVEGGTRLILSPTIALNFSP